MTEKQDAADRIIEVFLPEALGALPPPGRASAIMRHLRRRRVLRRAGFAAVAAAAAAIGIALWLPAPPERAYPQPTARGDFLTLDAPEIRRGALVYARQGGAELELGGYAYVLMTPFTIARVVGEEKAEAIYLEAGEIECEVQSDGLKKFYVHTEWGTVSVKGTRFTVRLLEKEEGMNRQRLVVKVLAGAVLLAATSGAQAVVCAGEEEVAVDERGAIAPAAEKKPQTNEEKEKSALAAIRAFLRERLRHLEAAAMADPEVAQARQAAEEAARAYAIKLQADAGHKALEEEKMQLENERLGLLRRVGGEGGDRQAVFAEIGRIWQGLQEARKRMAEFPDTVPELADLKRKKQEAMATFWDKYQAKLEAGAEYREIAKAMQEMASWQPKDEKDEEEGGPGWMRRLGRGKDKGPGERDHMPGGRRKKPDGDAKQEPAGEKKEGGDVF